MCEEVPHGLSPFLSTRPPKGIKNSPILNKSDGELHEIMIKSRGHSVHMGYGIEPTLIVSSHVREALKLLKSTGLHIKR